MCPWTGGHDDGIADTPPEADSKFGNPAFTITGGTFVDSCHANGTTNAQPIGVASLDFMNYTDDIAMQMFTIDQAAVMASKVAPGGENYTLTQHGSLVLDIASVPAVRAESSLSIFPNPSTGIIQVSFDQSADELQNITVYSILGAQVTNVQALGTQKDVYSIDLSGMSKGIYLVKCNFASGSITRKILLQ